jgi:predicted flap endonuclease-1-like 5' DNA nuclease
MMSHFILELALWTLLAFFIGCLLGCLFRKWFGAAEIEPAKHAVYTPPPAIPKPAPVAAPIVAAPVVAAPVAPREPVTPAPRAPIMSQGKMERPKGISGPRGGKADNLQKISGVGPKNEKVLHNLGFFHFDQIAAWTAEQIEWVDDHLKFNGRIKREEWIKQSKLLADGNEAEFNKLYGTGGLKTAQGQTQSGSRTRK